MWRYIFKTFSSFRRSGSRPSMTDEGKVKASVGGQRQSEQHSQHGVHFAGSAVCSIQFVNKFTEIDQLSILFLYFLFNIKLFLCKILSLSFSLLCCCCGVCVTQVRESPVLPEVIDLIEPLTQRKENVIKYVLYFCPDSLWYRFR